MIVPNSVRASRESRSKKIRQKESNDEEGEISDYSFEVETADYLRNTNTPENHQRTSHGIEKEITTNDDTEENTLDIIRPRRRSSILENETNLGTRKGSNEFRSDGAFKYDEIESTEILERKRKRRLSRRRRSENRSLETSKDPEENRKKASSRARGISTSNSGVKDTTGCSRKKGKRFQGESEETELPIAEILKKAQENNRTKYEEPIPLTELTSDRIYVQRRNGFSTMKIAGGRSASRKKVEKSAGSYSHPIGVAIMVQKVWKCSGFIYQGLLGGMAFMHFILIHTYFQDSTTFLDGYSFIAEIYTNIFTFLIIMSLIATFDKFDFPNLNGEHLREIYTTEARSVIAIPMYLITFCLHQVSRRVDDKLSLIYYNASSSTFENYTSIEVPLDEMTTWQRMTLSKDALAVLAWFFVSLGSRDDMLLLHLEAMEKYAENLYPTT